MGHLLKQYVFKYVKESLVESDYNFFEEEILSKISFSEKINIVKKMNLLTNSLETKAKEINTLRNRLMHLPQKMPEYKKIDVKKDKTIVDEIFKDYVAIDNYLSKKGKELGIFP